MSLNYKQIKSSVFNKDCKYNFYTGYIMADYKSSVREILHKDVLEFEGLGFSDSQIALHYGLSKMGFSKIRNQMGWVRTKKGVRSDKGVPRKSSDEKRERRNRYMREYYRRNGKDYEVVCVCDWCGVDVTPSNYGIEGNG